MAYPPELIEQIRQASDIVQVVQQWVPLKKAGASYKGLCPFHQEKTPSFNVVPAKQIFHCFGCGEGGDVFAFVQKIQKLDFLEALKLLAERAGIALPERERDEAGRRQEEERRRQEEAGRRLLELAAAWFRRNLEESAEGQTARAYAEGRGLDPATRERFGLGYAPADGGALLRAAQAKGYGEAELIGAGLALKGERGTYARFRARLVFPIHDSRGRLCGFGGRLLGPGEPKYLNSPESPLFSKGRLLYPWPQAREALGKGRQALLCEGYLDAIACHQAGLEQALATLGTALTADHARLLKRHVERVLLVFDADAAGLRAARRAGEPLLEAGLEVRVAALKGAKDPDELLRREGPQALRQALEEAQGLLDFCLGASLAAAGPRPSPSQRAAALADLFPLLARLGSSSEGDAALSAAAARVGIDAGAARQDYEAFRRGEVREAEPAAPAPASAAPEPGLPEGLQKVESELLALLATHRELVGEARSGLEASSRPELCREDLRAAAALLWKAPGGVTLLLPDDGSEAYKLGDALLRELSVRRLAQLAPPEDSLRELLLRREELLLKARARALRLALRQPMAAEESSSLLRQVNELDTRIAKLRDAQRG